MTPDAAPAYRAAPLSADRKRPARTGTDDPDRPTAPLRRSTGPGGVVRPAAATCRGGLISDLYILSAGRAAPFCVTVPPAACSAVLSRAGRADTLFVESEVQISARANTSARVAGQRRDVTAPRLTQTPFSSVSEFGTARRLSVSGHMSVPGVDRRQSQPSNGRREQHRL